MAMRLSRRCIAAAIFAACAYSIASAEVFRCTEGGKTVYSDRPCQADAATTVLVPPRSTDPVAINPQHEANLGRLAIGQTPLQVEMVWGRPKAKNIDTGSSGRTEQWVYERPDGTFYVYFRGGLVSNYSQQSEGARVPGNDPPVLREPTQAEIDAQIRADKAGERRFIGDGIHQSVVLSRIGEPDSKIVGVIVECWLYNATRLDAQTNTKICFGLDGTVINVERLVAR
jgi:hypothetical protein